MGVAARKLMDGAAAQAFPVIAATNTTTSTATSTTHTINLPSGIVSGNLLFLVVQYKQDTATVSSFSQTWNALATTTNSNGRVSMFWRIADGTEGSTTTMTISVTSDFVLGLAYRVTGAQSVEVGTYAAGTSTSPNPPSLSPSWGSAKTLWAMYIGANDNRQSLSSYPTNYTLSQITSIGTVSSSSTGQEGWLAGYQNEAASEDPGAGTFSGSITWYAQTIAFRPS